MEEREYGPLRRRGSTGPLRDRVSPVGRHPLRTWGLLLSKKQVRDLTTER